MVSNTKTILVIGIIVVVIVVAAAAVVLSGDDDDDDSGHEVAITAEPYFSDKLMVYGNANDDDTIDSKDIDTIRSIMRDDLRAEDHPYADANCDGVINEDDIASSRTSSTARRAPRSTSQPTWSTGRRPPPR